MSKSGFSFNSAPNSSSGLRGASRQILGGLGLSNILSGKKDKGSLSFKEERALLSHKGDQERQTISHKGEQERQTVVTSSAAKTAGTQVDREHFYEQAQKNTPEGHHYAGGAVPGGSVKYARKPVEKKATESRAPNVGQQMAAYVPGSAPAADLSFDNPKPTKKSPKFRARG